MPSDPPLLSVEKGQGCRYLKGFGCPFGIGRDGTGNLLIADMDLHGIVRFAPDFQSYEWLDDEKGWSARHSTAAHADRSAKRPPGVFNGPHSVACDEDGRIFVTAYYDPGLFILFPNGELASRVSDNPLFSLKGPATGVLNGRTLLLTEYALHGVFAFDTDGGFLGAFGGGEDGFRGVSSFDAGNGPGFFDRPHMSVADLNGNIIVADTWNHRLQRFSFDGRFNGILGGTEPGWRDATADTPAGNGSFAFHAPVALCITDDNGLLVTDWGNNRLKWYDRDGSLVSIEDDLGLDKPYDAKVFGQTCVVANSHRGEVIVRQADACGI
jgi:hypothetical protein